MAGVSSAALSATSTCAWREPARTYPIDARWTCNAVGWTDGDTFRAVCDGQHRSVAIRVRGLDTDERGQGRWEEARDELRRRTAERARAPSRAP